jgi:hypothetical protein
VESCLCLNFISVDPYFISGVADDLCISVISDVIGVVTGIHHEKEYFGGGHSLDIVFVDLTDNKLEPFYVFFGFDGLICCVFLCIAYIYITLCFFFLQGNC